MTNQLYKCKLVEAGVLYWTGLACFVGLATHVAHVDAIHQNHVHGGNVEGTCVCERPRLRGPRLRKHVRKPASQAVSTIQSVQAPGRQSLVDLMVWSTSCLLEGADDVEGEAWTR